MAYKIIRPFRDRYLKASLKEGFYPHDDPRLPKGWVESLAKGTNRLGLVYLKEVGEPADKKGRKEAPAGAETGNTLE